MQCGNAEDRAQWNASLEKDLVDLLREHDTPEHKGQNGWSSEAWNTIVKKFHQKNPYARYEKKKIQEKEKGVEKRIQDDQRDKEAKRRFMGRPAVQDSSGSTTLEKHHHSKNVIVIP